MSKIGKTLISLPESVKFEQTGDEALVRGPKGELKITLPQGITAKLVEGKIQVERKDELQQTKALHGLVRSLLANFVEGVTQGFSKRLKLIGTGYRVKAQGSGLSMTVGYSHPVDVQAVAGVSFKVEGNDTIVVEGIDKQLVGQVAANIRKIKPPEAYKGKGIRYEEEVVRTKPGKTTSA